MKYLFLLLLLISGVCYGQTTYYIRADSTRLQKVGGNNELIIENGTKNVTGVLVNIGNGRTRFSKPVINGDTLFIGVDTVLGVGSGGGAGSGISQLGAGNCLIIVNDSTYRVDTGCAATRLWVNHRLDSVQAAIATALALKADKSTTITAGVGLNGGGDLSTNRTIDVDTVEVSTRLRLKHVQDSIDAALNGKQATLVSGTNIKTINGNSLLGSGDLVINSDPNYQWVLQTDSATASLDYRGLFWDAGVEYKEFAAEFLVKPLGSGYFLSAGYGGTHDLLFGVAGDSTNGYALSGNIFYDGTPLSFVSTDVLNWNEWAHVAIYYDGTRVVLTINGVPTNCYAYTGLRRTAANTDGTLLLWGSDHNNSYCRALGVKIMEGNIPYDNPHQTVVRPAVSTFLHATVNKSGTNIPWDFLAYYGDRSLQDYSAGFNGNKHNGVLSEAQTPGSITNLQGQYSLPLEMNRDKQYEPVWVKDTFAYQSISPATPSTPSGATIYEPFSKPNVHYGNSTTLGLGVTPVGSKTWNNSSNYGIISGNAYANGTAAGITYVTDTNTDDSIIIRRPVGAFPCFDGATYRIIFRMTDANNYEYLYADQYGQGFIFQVVAGVNTGHLGSMSITSSWTSMCIKTSGSTAKVYTDNTLRGTQTMTENLTGTNKGFELSTPILRITSFERYN